MEFAQITISSERTLQNRSVFTMGENTCLANYEEKRIGQDLGNLTGHISFKKSASGLL
jgi:hypothetical protein